MAKKVKSPYKVLGLSPGCSDKDIQSAYRAKAKKTHPDAGGTTEKFMEVQEAYQLLSDPDSRKKYDAVSKLVDTPPVQQPTINRYTPSHQTSGSAYMGSFRWGSASAAAFINFNNFRPTHNIVDIYDPNTQYTIKQTPTGLDVSVVFDASQCSDINSLFSYSRSSTPIGIYFAWPARPSSVQGVVGIIRQLTVSGGAYTNTNLIALEMVDCRPL